MKAGALVVLQSAGGLAGRVAAVVREALRRHYLTMVSAAVLTGALAIAMTNPSISQEQQREAMSAPSTDFDRAGADVIAAYASESPLSRPWQIYYILRSEDQRERVSQALMADRRTGNLVEGYHAERSSYFFVVAGTEEEYLQVRMVVEVAVQTAEHAGVRVRVLDLR